MLKRLAKALAFMCPLKVNLLHCNLTIKKKKKKKEETYVSFNWMLDFCMTIQLINIHKKSVSVFFFIQSFTVNVKNFAI